MYRNVKLLIKIQLIDCMMFSPQSIFRIRRTFLKFPKRSSAPVQFVPVGSLFVYQSLNPKSSTSESLCSSTGRIRMMKSSPRSGERYRDPSSNPEVSHLRKLIGSGEYSGSLSLSHVVKFERICLSLESD